MPLDFGPYEPQEYAPFFHGLLPEGAVLANLAERYQVPRNDFLAFFEKLGCESIGALTFVAEGTDLADFEPSYAPMEPSMIDQMREDAERAVTEMTDELRLSLSGAQSKVAWYLPEGIDARDAALRDWRLPLGTAPSSHIVKVARTGREELAYNELACMEIARQCGFATSDVALIPEIPGAIAVKRYDRVPLGNNGLLRLHQEDFCQARGLPLYLKYADAYPEVSYIQVIAKLIDAVSERPAQDRLEMARRLLLHYLIGNSDNHLKNYAFLYSEDWKRRTLAPLYDLTCIPLTGYSTKMAFALGAHRELSEISADDLASWLTIWAFLCGRQKKRRSCLRSVSKLSIWPASRGPTCKSWQGALGKTLRLGWPCLRHLPAKNRAAGERLGFGLDPHLGAGEAAFCRDNLWFFSGRLPGFTVAL